MKSNVFEYEKIEDKRVVLLQSGGLDSNICAAILSHYGFEIHYLFVNYGQNTHEIELKTVKDVVNHYGGTLHCVDLKADWLMNNKLSKGNIDDWNAEGDFNTIDEGTYVPLRNMFLLSLAGSLAEELNIPYICAALDGAEDVDGIPQCGTTDKHPTFVKKLEEAIREGSSMHHLYSKDITIMTPLIGLFKSEIIKLGIEFNADLSKSWSCYNSFDKPCGKCSACKERAKGFYQAGVKDPLMLKYDISVPLNKIFS